MERRLAALGPYDSGARRGAAYQEVVDHFQKIFHGDNHDGLILRERWLASDGLFERLAERHHLAVFTGRLRWEAHVTLNRFAEPGLFEPVIGADDVARTKPDPEGIHKIRATLEHGKCWYVGDTVDDARAASAAGVPFIGIAARANPRYAELVRLLEAEGAVAVLDDINSMEAVLAAEPLRFKRNTKETQISGELRIEGRGRYEISTGIRFLDHMLELFTKHGGFDLKIHAVGDLDIDQHHTVEDTGILIGQLFAKALGDRKGINRAGYFVLPMDETLAVVAVDLGGRPALVYQGQSARPPGR